jgi:hypothetical protein
LGASGDGVRASCCTGMVPAHSSSSSSPCSLEGKEEEEEEGEEHRAPTTRRDLSRRWARGESPPSTPLSAQGSFWHASC